MNYLSQLAARTLHQLPSVQPLLPSRFESVRRNTLVETPVPMEYATFTPSAPSVTADAAAPSPIAFETPPVSTTDSPATHEAAPTPRPQLDAAPVNTTLVYQEKPRPVVENDRVAPTPPTTVIEHNTVTHMLERDSSTIVSNLTTTEHTTMLEQRPLIERERVFAPTTLVAPVEARAHVPSFAPQVTPYVPPAPDRVATPEPAPVIHVSIGRIEVRAVHTPAPSVQLAPTPKPALSLDEYLRGVRS